MIVNYTSRGPVKLPHLRRALADPSLDHAVFKMGLFTCSSSSRKASPALAMSGGGAYSLNLQIAVIVFPFHDGSIIKFRRTVEKQRPASASAV